MMAGCWTQIVVSAGFNKSSLKPFNTLHINNLLAVDSNLLQILKVPILQMKVTIWFHEKQKHQNVFHTPSSL